MKNFKPPKQKAQTPLVFVMNAAMKGVAIWAMKWVASL
ncbi:hypothetical protein HPCPY6081_0216 [Helicobacter pylori CPY6081]|nr:hypothetical protein HPCPY6081_0216 [Helicobacter pylori CPY6081]